MSFFSRSSFWQRLFSKLFNRKDKSSLSYLNAAQFLGALNDNIYKLTLIFFLIELEGSARANAILSMAGALFVIPFLLFSSAAGVLADRVSKQRMLVWIKWTEIAIFALVMCAFAFRSPLMGYALLFLLSTHSAIFGPPKYGIIPELVPKQEVSRANGLITAFTYLAIIVGTFLASFLTEITNHNFVLIGGFCLLVACTGFVCILKIKYTPPQGSKKGINPFFFQEIIQTLRACREKQHLLTAIFGSAFFLFVGAFTQLNIIPFAIDVLKFSEVAGGYLFLATAFGIAIGGYIGGRVSKKRIELGISCFAGLMVALLFFCLALFSHNLFADIAFLFLLGVFGGIFVVPFDSFIQVYSSDTKRGQAIAAAAFLSFLGVLLASGALYLFNEMLGLSPATSFAVMGIFMLLISLLLLTRLSDLAFSYFSRRFLRSTSLESESLELLEKTSSPLLILQEATPSKFLLLTGLLPHLHLLLLKKNNERHLLAKIFHSIHVFPLNDKLRALFSTREALPCLYWQERQISKQELENFLKEENFKPIWVSFEKLPRRVHFH